MFNNKIQSTFIICLLFVVLYPSFLFARPGEFELNCPYWFMTFDRAGYVDITYWYQSERHDYGYHEMMTGDWAAAVWYDGINSGSNQAQWITDAFIAPTFNTTQIFDFSAPASQAYAVSNDPCNPIWTDANQPTEYIPGTNYYSIGSTGNDTGWSDVNDGKLQVTIHYEVVDLGANNGSPLSFRDANDQSAYVKSERYVLLQTYVFKNISASDINNLEFYQMMHGHPGTPGAYSLDTAASYHTDIFADDLENYTPYDSNHQTGNFKYDIT